MSFVIHLQLLCTRCIETLASPAPTRRNIEYCKLQSIRVEFSLFALTFDSSVFALYIASDETTSYSITANSNETSWTRLSRKRDSLSETPIKVCWSSPSKRNFASISRQLLLFSFLFPLLVLFIKLLINATNTS